MRFRRHSAQVTHISGELAPSTAPTTTLTPRSLTSASSSPSSSRRQRRWSPAGALSTNRPTFRARNARISGPAGSVVYRFEVATAGPGGHHRCRFNRTWHRRHDRLMVGELPWEQNVLLARVRDKRLYDQHAVRRRFFHNTSSAHGSSAPITDTTATSTTTARRWSGWSAAKHFTERSPADRSSRARQ